MEFLYSNFLFSKSYRTNSDNSLSLRIIDIYFEISYSNCYLDFEKIHLNQFFIFSFVVNLLYHLTSFVAENCKY